MLLHLLYLFQPSHPAAHASEVLEKKTLHSSDTERGCSCCRNLSRISVVNFSPSFVVHIFSSSTVSPPISCFIKCICFFLSQARYAETQPSFVFLIFLYALLHSTLPTTLTFAYFLVAHFQNQSAFVARFRRSLFVDVHQCRLLSFNLQTPCPLAGHFPQSSCRAPPAITCSVQLLL